MQISAIRFTGNEGQAALNRDNLSAVANLSDEQIREFSLLQTRDSFDQKKYNRTRKALYLGLPIAGGIAAAVNRTPKAGSFLVKSGKLSREFYSIKGPAARAVNGMKGFGAWALALVGAGIVIKVLDSAVKKSHKIRNFKDNHPMTALLTTLGAGFAALIGLQRLSYKSADKIKAAIIKNLQQVKTSKAEPGKLLKTASAIADYAKRFNDNKYVKLSSEWLNKTTAKVHPAIKGLGQVALSLLPLGMILGDVTYSSSAASKFNRRWAENYSSLKDFQLQAARELVNSEQV